MYHFVESFNFSKIRKERTRTNSIVKPLKTNSSLISFFSPSIDFSLCDLSELYFKKETLKKKSSRYCRHKKTFIVYLEKCLMAFLHMLFIL